MFDLHSLFGYSTIASITSDNGSTIVLTVQTGDGALFSVGQNVVLAPAGTLPLKSTSYVGRITAIATDTLTISYPQEGSTAHTAIIGWAIFNGETPKVFTDIESAITYNSAIRPPQGYVVNGKIVTSVSLNNLTVALKTLAGNDPSTTDPVYIRIGNTVYSVTAALSNTLNAGTNWFNSGATETATYEIDYFVYLGYNATDGVVIGFARVPYGTTYADFNTTTTNDKYCAISTTTHAVSTDIYENIGRFNAILSAGAGYTWSIPATSIIINRPINYTRNLSYLPQMTISSPMTLVSTASPAGNYQIIGNTINVSGQIMQAKGGTAATYNVFISAPMNMNISLNTPYGFANIDNEFGSVGLYGGGNNPSNLYQFRSASNMTADSVQRFADWGAVGTPLV